MYNSNNLFALYLSNLPLRPLSPPLHCTLLGLSFPRPASSRLDLRLSSAPRQQQAARNTGDRNEIKRLAFALCVVVLVALWEFQDFCILCSSHFHFINAVRCAGVRSAHRRALVDAGCVGSPARFICDGTDFRWGGIGDIRVDTVAESGVYTVKLGNHQG